MVKTALLEKDWYSFSEIRFTLPQVRWLLEPERLKMLREGRWPPEPRNSGYIGGSSFQLRAEGKFIRPAVIAAELDWRLKQTKTDGKLLQAQIEAGHDYLEPEAYCALKYCSGWRRKATPYRQWVAVWRQRNVRKTYTKTEGI